MPQEILTTLMRKHQRYLPVRDLSGALMPYFVTVANGKVVEVVDRCSNVKPGVLGPDLRLKEDGATTVSARPP